VQHDLLVTGIFQVSYDIRQVLVDGPIGSREDADSLSRKRMNYSASIGGILRAFHESAVHQDVDDPRDVLPGHCELERQVGLNRLPAVEVCQHPVLGERQVEKVQGRVLRCAPGRRSPG
jgi:hypothetical protein